MGAFPWGLAALADALKSVGPWVFLKEGIPHQVLRELVRDDDPARAQGTHEDSGGHRLEGKRYIN